MKIGNYELKREDFDYIYHLAHTAGMKAGNACNPTPMVVEQHASVLNDNSPVVKRWVVDDGVCGFAWVWFKGNTAWGKWAKKMGYADSSYPSGLAIWCHEFNQSMTRKEAYCHAFTEVLRKFGIKAYSRSRMD